MILLSPVREKYINAPKAYLVLYSTPGIWIASALQDPVVALQGALVRLVAGLGNATSREVYKGSGEAITSKTERCSESATILRPSD